MEHVRPSSDQWRTLYDLAVKVYALAPWEFMTESELLGVTDPVSGETNYVSVMGELGEHLAIALYLGEPGLRGFLTMSTSPSFPPELMFETPQLQLSFEDRTELSAEDRAIIKELGLKFRGRQAWPVFVSIRPGYFPWPLEADEALTLATALSQLLDVAPRFAEGDAARRRPKRSEILVREPRGAGDGLEWHEVTRKLKVPRAPEIRAEIPQPLLDSIRSLRLTVPRIEVGLDVVSSIGERGARPRAAYCLLVVEPRSGFVLGQDVFSIETSVEAMYGGMARRLLTVLQRAGDRPLVVDVASSHLASVLQPALAPLRCQVRLRPRLPECDRAMASLRAFLSR